MDLKSDYNIINTDELENNLDFHSFCFNQEKITHSSLYLSLIVHYLPLNTLQDVVEIQLDQISVVLALILVALNKVQKNEY